MIVILDNAPYHHNIALRAVLTSRHNPEMILVLDNAPYHHNIVLRAVDFDARGWIVLFTPPYCADLQPIELWWAAGKNWARAHHSGRRAR